jgi:hypothetical protein
MSKRREDTKGQHINEVTITGKVTRVFMLQGGIVCARIAPGKRGRKDERISVMFPDGKTEKGDPVTLDKDIILRVDGYIKEVPFDETLNQFLRKAGAKKVKIEDDDVAMPRIATYVMAAECSVIDKPEGENNAHVSGVVVSVNDFKDGTVARLASYSGHEEGDSPNYISVIFPGGKTTAGVEVSPKKGTNIMVTGSLIEKTYSESLTTFLRKAQRPELIGDGYDGYKATRQAVYLEADSFINVGRSQR